MSQYFVRTGQQGKVHGPFSEEQVRKYLQAGKLKDTHEVSLDSEVWSLIRDVDELVTVGRVVRRPSAGPPALEESTSLLNQQEEAASVTRDESSPHEKTRFFTHIWYGVPWPRTGGGWLLLVLSGLIPYIVGYRLWRAMQIRVAPRSTLVMVLGAYWCLVYGACLIWSLGIQNQPGPPAALLPAPVPLVDKIELSSPSDPPYVDENYRFQLKAPSPKWKVLNAEEISATNADAVAGMMNIVLGGVCEIIVEEIGGTGVTSYAETVRDNMAEQFFSESEAGPVETINFLGREAARFQVAGTHQGRLARAIVIVFEHQGFAYQLVATGRQDRLSESGMEAEPFFTAFSLTDGKVQPPVKFVVTRDQHGVGWRVKGGTFETAVYGLRVGAVRGWYPIVGRELSLLNGDAEVALKSQDGRYTVVVIPERGPTTDQDEFVKVLKRRFARSLAGAVELDSVTIPINGEDVQFSGHVVEGPPEEAVRHGVMHRGDLFVQILVTSAKKYAGELDTVLAEAVSGVGLLSPNQRSTLKAELLKQPDPQNSVSSTHSLRNGVFTEYALGLVWEIPREFWRVSGGDDAKKLNKASVLFYQHPRLGLYGQVIAERIPGVTAKIFHKLVINKYFGEDGGESKVPSLPTTLAGHPAITSTGDVQLDDLKLRYKVLTCVRGDWSFQVLSWGLPDVMDRHGQQVDAALSGFRFPDRPPVPQSHDMTMFTDHRLGFQIDFSGGLFDRPKPTKQEPPVSTVAVHVLGRDEGFHMQAICLNHIGSNLQAVVERLEVVWSAGAKVITKKTLVPVRSSGKMFGQACQSLAWHGKSAGVEVHYAFHQSTLYSVLLTTDDVSRLDFLRDEVRKRVRLLVP
jgi:hypothetical protein